MLAPRNRLLFWFAAVVVPFSLMTALEPGAFLLAAGAVGGLCAAALTDAVGARRAVAGLSARLPAVVRLSVDREARFEVRIRNESRVGRTIRLALGLPRQIDCATEEVQVSLPPEVEWSGLEWACVPRQRGNFRASGVHLEVTSRLGFWSARRRIAAGSELRVYPNLFAERRELAALFLHRGTFGLHAQRQIGKGREFEKLREYVPGDGYDEVHWKATARRGRPITKVFQIERTQEVYVVIDASRLSARPAIAPAPQPTQPAEPDTEAPARQPVPATALDRYVTASLVLGLAAEQQGDFFGILTFAEKVDAFVRASNGKQHYSACRDALYLLQPKPVSPDYDELCAFIRHRLRRRALLVFLTALDDPVLAESLVRNLDVVRRQHLLLVNMLQPPGVRPLFSDPAVRSIDDLYQHLGGHLLWQKLRELEKVLQRRGIHFALLPNERLGSDLVSQYLNVKRRQAL